MEASNDDAAMISVVFLNLGLSDMQKRKYRGFTSLLREIL